VATTMDQSMAPGVHAGGMDNQRRPDPEVPERPRPRSYSARYKAEVLAEYERLDKAGKGALLSGTAPYYAEAFFPMPGRCFRLVARDGEGGPIHCPEPPTWRGTFRAPTAAATRSRRARGTGRR
jgi:hypothetical protein